MKYSTTIQLNRMGFSELENDIQLGKITFKEYAETKKLMTREQVDELRQDLWERAIQRLLSREDINIHEYMEGMQLKVYKDLTHCNDEEIPF